MNQDPFSSAQKAIIESGFSDEKVAELTGVPAGTIHKIRNGSRIGQRHGTLDKIVMCFLANEASPDARGSSQPKLQLEEGGGSSTPPTLQSVGAKGKLTVPYHRRPRPDKDQ